MSTITISTDQAPLEMILEILHAVDIIQNVTVTTGFGGIEITFTPPPPRSCRLALVDEEQSAEKPAAPTSTSVKSAAKKAQPAAAQAGKVQCRDCPRTFGSIQALGVHRARTHVVKGTLAAGPIEGDRPAVGESREQWEARKRDAAAGAL